MTFSPGGVGLGFNFYGSTGYVNVPNSNSLKAIKQTVTVEMWAIPQPLPPQDDVAYMYSRRDPLVAESFSIYVVGDGTVGVLLDTTNSSTSSKFESAPGAVAFGQLQHIAATADANSSSVNAYVNGVERTLESDFRTGKFQRHILASVPPLSWPETGCKYVRGCAGCILFSWRTGRK